MQQGPQRRECEECTGRGSCPGRPKLANLQNLISRDSGHQCLPMFLYSRTSHHWRVCLPGPTLRDGTKSALAVAGEARVDPASDRGGFVGTSQRPRAFLKVRGVSVRGLLCTLPHQEGPSPWPRHFSLLKASHISDQDLRKDCFQRARLSSHRKGGRRLYTGGRGGSLWLRLCAALGCCRVAADGCF